jgi:hypothetical protein
VVSVIALCTSSFGRGGYFLEERKKRSPRTASAKMINPNVFFMLRLYHGAVRRIKHFLSENLKKKISGKRGGKQQTR